MKLTPNFSKSEFDSKDGAEMPEDVLANVTRLANALEKIREVIQCPIKINSGYRSPEHNKKIGGALNSMHLKGLAADIVPIGASLKLVYTMIEKLVDQGQIPDGGLKLYDTFIHYDIRGHRARW